MRLMPLFRILLIALLAGACSENSPPRQLLHFQGICDGSAAVRIDADTVIVAYDEKNSLYTFSSGGGVPLAEYPYGSLLDIDDHEVDVEAAALVSDGIWWIGSHGRDGDGDKASNRSLLFKTGSSDSGELVVLDKITDLKRRIVEADNGRFFSKKILKKQPKKGGFNIEGMAALANGDLFLGLRSPLSSGMSGNALIIHLAANVEGFVVRDIYQLDLGDRGIRDIHEYDGGFRIVAGDIASGGVFALYDWQPGGQARVRSHLDRRLNPEALVALDDRWLIFSDDGKVVRKQGRTCDELATDSVVDEKYVYFRAIELTLTR